MTRYLARDRIAIVAALAARNLARDPRAAPHVSGRDFWHYAVAEGGVTLSAVASSPGDDACRELLAVHTAFYGEQDADAASADLIAARRLVVRLQVSHLYGVMTTAGGQASSAGRFLWLSPASDAVIGSQIAGDKYRYPFGNSMRPNGRWYFGLRPRRASEAPGRPGSGESSQKEVSDSARRGSNRPPSISVRAGGGATSRQKRMGS